MRQIHFIVTISILLFTVFDLSAQNGSTREVNDFREGKTMLEQLVDRPGLEFQRNVLVSKEITDESLKALISEYKLFKLDETTLHNIYVNRPTALSLIVVTTDGDYELVLVEQKITSEDFQVATSDGNAFAGAPSGVHYRGIVKGKDNSLAAVSFFENRITILASSGESGNLVVGKLRDREEYISYFEHQLRTPPGFECDVVEGLDRNRHTIHGFPDQTERLANNCVQVHIEAANDLYQSFNSSTSQTQNYIEGLFNEVAALYANQNMNVVISFIKVWTTNDPFSSGSCGGLEDFRQYFNNGATMNGDLAHLLSGGGSSSSGCAWVNTLCTQEIGYRTAHSIMLGFFEVYPSYSLDVTTFAHEMGHNLGSEHTHACVWNGNNTQIDDCGSISGDEQPCYNSNSPVIPANGGTVMSYCDNIGNLSFIDLSLGFHPQVLSLIQGNINNASCLVACAASECPPVTLSVDNISTTSIDLSWTAAGTEDGFQIGWQTLGGSADSMTTTNNFYSIEGLSPCTVYSIALSSICSGELFNTVLTTATTMSVPVVINCPDNITQFNDAGECQAVVSVPAPEIIDICGPNLNDTLDLSVGNQPGLLISNTNIPNGWTLDSIVISGAPQGAIITSLTLDVNLTHTWIGDIEISLVSSENNLIYTMMSRPGYSGAGDGCSNDNAVITFDDNAAISASALENICAGNTPWFEGSAQPINPMTTSFGGNLVNKSWYIIVADMASGDNGILNSWALNFSYVDAGGRTGHYTVQHDMKELHGDPGDLDLEPVFSNEEKTMLNPTGPGRAVVSLVNDYNGTDDASDTYPDGTTTVNWIVTDDSGNSDSCSMTITVDDNEAPVAVCQDITVPLDGGGNATILSGDIDNGSIDNCAITSMNLDKSTFTCNDVGIQTVTLSLMDAAGNPSFCTASVNVTDLTGNCNPCSNQEIGVISGWSIISSYIDEDNPDMLDIVQGFENDILIIKNGSGQVVFPSVGLNQIGDWQVTEGYQIKTIAPLNLEIGCSQVDPLTTPISLPLGWSIMAYLRDDPMDAMTALAGIASDAILVKNGAGQIYFPSLTPPLNLIGDLLPGEGYQIKMLNAATLTYPGNTVRVSGSTYTPPGESQRYILNKNTGNNATIIFPEGSIGVLQDGDEIGVFSGRGELTGSGVYIGSHLALTVWGSDPVTNDELNMLDGEPYRYKMWRPSLAEEFDILVEYDSGDPFFTTNGLSILKKGMIPGLGVVGSELSTQLFVYPNPARNYLNADIWLPENSKVDWRIFDVTGKELIRVNGQELVKGQNLLRIDVNDLPSGKYFYRMDTRDKLFNGGFVKME